MDKPWKVILAFIGVFVAGVIFGGVFTIGVSKKFRAEINAAQAQVAQVQAPQPKAEPPRKNATPTGAGTPAPSVSRGFAPFIMRALTQRLNPTPEQRKAIGQIVARANEDCQRLGREHITDVQRVTDRMYDDVSALLSPEQRTQLEKMRQETLEKARQERMKRMVPQEPPKEKEGANLPAALPRAPAPTK